MDLFNFTAERDSQLELNEKTKNYLSSEQTAIIEYQRRTISIERYRPACPTKANKR